MEDLNPGFKYFDDHLPQYDAAVDQLHPEFELVSLAMYGPSKNPRIVASWRIRTEKNPGAKQWYSGVRTLAGMQEWFGDAIAKGRTPTFVASCGTGLAGDGVRFCGVASKIGWKKWEPFVQFGWTLAELYDAPPGYPDWPGPATGFRGTQMSLRWATLYESAGVERTVTLWAEDLRAGNWSIRVYGPPFAPKKYSPTLKQAFDAMMLGGVRPDLVVPLRPFNPVEASAFEKAFVPGWHSDRYLVVWRDDWLVEEPFGGWLCQVQMSKYQFKKKRGSLVFDAAFVPLHVGVSGPKHLNQTKKAHFSAIFAPAFARAVKREWKVIRAPGEKLADTLGRGSVASFDSWMKRFLQAYGIRCACLAIVRDNRLVFTHSYKWAEPQYRNPWHTDIYRIGSVSKCITAIAAIVACQKGLINLNTNIRDLLGNSLRRLDGKLPTAVHWDTLNLQHLLRHRGGWRLPSTPQPTQAEDWFNQHKKVRAFYKFFGVPLTSPAQPHELLRYVATRDAGAFQPTTAANGLPGQSSWYSGTNGQMVGHAIAKANGWASTTLNAQLDTMQQLLFEPLGITRARRILGVEQRRDGVFEIQAHPAMPNVAPSDRVAAALTKPWVPAQYSSNWEQGPAAGGWLMSMVDLARIGAALPFTSDDLFSMEWQTTMMWKSSPPAELDPNGGARHGFFNFGPVAAPNGGMLPAVGHNGSLLGGNAVLGIRFDGLVMALAVNGDVFAGYDQNGVERWPRWGLGMPQFIELNAIANSVTKWPDVDLFDQYALPAVKTRPGLEFDFDFG